MNTETPAPITPRAVDNGVPVFLPPEVFENFEKARRQIQEFYAMSPDTPALVALWLACGTASQIRREFELAVLDISRRSIEPHANGEIDEDCL